MEKRSTARYPLQLDTVISSLDTGRPLEERTRTRNISSHGMLFASGKNWVPGQPVSMLIKVGEKVSPPHGYDLSLKGHIVRQNRLPGEDQLHCAVEFKGRWQFIHREEGNDKESSSMPVPGNENNKGGYHAQ